MQGDLRDMCAAAALCHAIETRDDDALVLLCHRDVIDEPVVTYGPFVMNTEEEIREAYLEYQSGQFGRVGG